MEGGPVHAELRLARFDLDARPFATAYECLKQLVELLQGVSPCANAVAVDRKLVPQGLKISLSVSKSVAMLIQQTLPQRTPSS